MELLTEIIVYLIIAIPACSVVAMLTMIYNN